MSESLEGISVIATRQNSGSLLYTVALPPAGGTKAPAATICAVAIFASGKRSDVKPSHEAANAGAASAQERIKATFINLPEPLSESMISHPRGELSAPTTDYQSGTG